MTCLDGYITEALGAIQNNKSYATWQQGLLIILDMWKATRRFV